MEQSRLNTSEVEQIKRLAVEYRTLCESAWKFNDGKFLDVSKTKLGHIKKWLGNLCDKVVSESEHVGSTLTKKDCRKIMELVTAYAWNCWNMGADQFPWEEVEQDYTKTRLDEFLNSLVAPSQI